MALLNWNSNGMDWSSWQAIADDRWPQCDRLEAVRLACLERAQAGLGQGYIDANNWLTTPVVNGRLASVFSSQFETFMINLLDFNNQSSATNFCFLRQGQTYNGLQILARWDWLTLRDEINNTYGPSGADDFCGQLPYSISVKRVCGDLINPDWLWWVYNALNLLTITCETTTSASTNNTQIREGTAAGWPGLSWNTWPSFNTYPVTNHEFARAGAARTAPPLGSGQDEAERWRTEINYGNSPHPDNAIEFDVTVLAIARRHSTPPGYDAQGSTIFTIENRWVVHTTLTAQNEVSPFVFQFGYDDTLPPNVPGVGNVRFGWHGEWGTGTFGRTQLDATAVTGGSARTPGPFLIRDYAVTNGFEFI